MPNCIVRFGGNNLNDSQAIESFLSILKSSDQNHIIVVSSISEIQDNLSRSLQLLKQGSLKSQEVIQQIQSTIDGLSLSLSTDVSKILDEEISKLESLLKGIEYTGDYSLALQDVVISFSERITSLLLNQFLVDKNLDSQLVLPEDLGLIVSAEFGNASVLETESAKRIQAFNWSTINIIPGSYGITEEGKVTRLGKRASDYTASSLVSILEEEKLELWQIGRAYKTVDENLVKEASFIKSLTYEEASELSYFNQSSVHPRIVEPLTEKHIPIHVYDFVDGKKQLQTSINSKNIVAEDVVKSVAHSDDIAILKLNGPGVGFKPGILAHVTTAFSKHQINIRSVITAQTSINIIIDKASVKIARQLISGIELPSVSKITIDEHISLIAIVGHGMQKNHGISAKLFTAVSNNKINVLLSGSGASDLVSYLIIDEKDKIKAIQEIHKTFFK